MYRNGNSGNIGNNSKNGVSFKKAAFNGWTIDETSEEDE